MFKKLCLLLVVVFSVASLSFAVEKAAVNAVKVGAKQFPVINTEGARQVETVYSTNFETEGEWTAQQLANGPSFQWVTDKSHSPTHSWWVSDDQAMTADEANPIETAVVSPVIHLPADFGGYQAKVLELSYWGNVETPNTSEGGYVYDVFQLDMERPYSGDNMWHTSTTNGFDGTSSWWCGSEALGTYDINWRQQLVTPVMDLSAAAGPIILTFKNAPSSEPAFDYCFLDVSKDAGATWTEIARWDEENATIVWYDESFDLSAYASTQTVVRWRFESDGGYNSPNGWRIDNVLITDGTTQFVFDDGGDTATQLIPVEHPLSWVRMHYDYNDGRLGTTWFIMDNSTKFNGSLDLRPYAGTDTRFRIRVSTDGYNRLGAAPGYGFYFDDFTIYGQGVAQIDGAIQGVTGLYDAAPGKAFNPKVIIGNEGIQDLNGPILWYGSIKDALGTEVAKPVGRFEGTLKQGESAVVGTLAAKQWIPTDPGSYTFEVTTLQVNSDGWTINNSWPATAFTVMGLPYTELVFAENFVGGTGDDLGRFGWTIEHNGTGPDTWISNGYFGSLNQGPVISGYRYFNVVDSTVDESILSPTIDISKIGAHNTLFLDFFLRYQPGNVALDQYGFGFYQSAFKVFASGDDGTWVEVFSKADTDNLGGAGFGFRANVPTIDLSQFAASNTLKLKFQCTSENGYIFVCGFCNVKVYAGVSRPGIRSLADVPADQGKQAQMVFRASYNDLLPGDAGPIPVKYYEIYRGLPTGAGACASYATFADMLRNSHAKAGDKMRTEEDGVVWEFLWSLPAIDQELYGAIVPTVWDGVETQFVVAARTDDEYVFDFSDPKAVTTEDNLAPGAPGSLVVVTTMDKAENMLTWTEAYSDVNDVAGYKVYRSLTADVQGTEIGTTTALEFVDKTVEIGKKYSYTVVAFDFAGNQSAGVKGAVTTSVGAEDSAIPTAYRMDQNYPNPFNPTTMISFALPQAGNVVMTVFNMSGQAIETIYNGQMLAGYHKVSWNGNNVSAGIYFLELKAGNFQKTIKMTLVK
jgi:hypothetical protein